MAVVAVEVVEEVSVLMVSEIGAANLHRDDLFVRERRGKAAAPGCVPFLD
jgi:hypothetical protein